jgi:hypothetical protein
VIVDQNHTYHDRPPYRPIDYRTADDTPVPRQASLYIKKSVFCPLYKNERLRQPAAPDAVAGTKKLVVEK